MEVATVAMAATSHANMPHDASGQGTDDHADTLDALIEHFVAQDVLQWYADHPYELIPDDDRHEVHRHSRQLTRGHKRVRWMDQVASVKDDGLRSKLILMARTRAAAHKKPKQPAPPPVPSPVQLPPLSGDDDGSVSAQEVPEPRAYPYVPWEDMSDRMLNPVVFLEVQAKVAAPFELDAFARDDGSNALCSQFCSPARSFA